MTQIPGPFVGLVDFCRVTEHVTCYLAGNICFRTDAQ